MKLLLARALPLALALLVSPVALAATAPKTSGREHATRTAEPQKAVKKAKAKPKARAKPRTKAKPRKAPKAKTARKPSAPSRKAPQNP